MAMCFNWSWSRSDEAGLAYIEPGGCTTNAFLHNKQQYISSSDSEPTILYYIQFPVFAQRNPTIRLSRSLNDAELYEKIRSGSGYRVPTTVDSSMI
jgi:hypothetical protein